MSIQITYLSYRCPANTLIVHFSNQTQYAISSKLLRGDECDDSIEITRIEPLDKDTLKIYFSDGFIGFPFTAQMLYHLGCSKGA